MKSVLSRFAIIVAMLCASTVVSAQPKNDDIKSIKVNVRHNNLHPILIINYRTVNDKTDQDRPPEFIENNSGIRIHNGKVVIGGAGEFEMILESASLTVGDKIISLDVGELANAWDAGEEDPIPPHFTYFEDLGSGVMSLKVLFAKGGASDFEVEWWIYKEKSIRKSISFVGDEMPEWTK